MLKSQDILVVVMLFVLRRAGERITYADLARHCSMSASETHGALRRARESALVTTRAKEAAGIDVIPANLSEFVSFGAPYFWPVRRGPEERGIPTCHSLPAVAERLHLVAPSLPLVWPHPDGGIRGSSLAPLHRSIPATVLNWPLAHEIFALCDLVRLRDGRLSFLARTELDSLLRS